MSIQFIDDDSLSLKLEQLLGKHIISLSALHGGRNSKVYKLYCSDHESFVAKVYPVSNLEGGNRLVTEFEALQFLIAQGVTGVPLPIISDSGSMCAIYQFVEGEDVSSESISETDVDQAVDFLLQLNSLKYLKESKGISVASDSFFSLGEACQGLQKRLSRLLMVPKHSLIIEALQEFLTKDYSSASGEIIEWCQRSAYLKGIDWDVALNLDESTLSPSDFGFHNALRTGKGEVIFVDFEYFGWDDPAKMISDFLLHPAMNLSVDLKKRFTNKVLAGFHEAPSLDERIEIVYALSGLRWVLILLNEFLPQIWEQRVASSVSKLKKEEVQEVQLYKANQMLKRICCEHRNFEYK